MCIYIAHSWHYYKTSVAGSRGIILLRCQDSSRCLHGWGSHILYALAWYLFSSLLSSLKRRVCQTRAYCLKRCVAPRVLLCDLMDNRWQKSIRKDTRSVDLCKSPEYAELVNWLAVVEIIFDRVQNLDLSRMCELRYSNIVARSAFIQETTVFVSSNADQLREKNY